MWTIFIMMSICTQRELGIISDITHSCVILVMTLSICVYACDLKSLFVNLKIELFGTLYRFSKFYIVLLVLKIYGSVSILS